MKALVVFLGLVVLVCMSGPAPAADTDIEERVEHGYADHGGVKIHYVRLGQGPLVVMLHGFPDYWYTWRHQMRALAQTNEVVAVDMRGYNLSDKPSGVAAYDLRLLVGDVVAVIRHLGRDKATLVGHDWGGTVAWQFAIHVPEMTEKLVILNMPHVRALRRELANNPQQREQSEYARELMDDRPHGRRSPDALARWVKDPGAREKYREAFSRSDFEAMRNYYRQNYAKPPYEEDRSPVIKVKAPVLMFHGLKDPGFTLATLSGTWEWIENDFTLVTIPAAGHWVHHDVPELVTRMLTQWIAR